MNFSNNAVPVLWRSLFVLSIPGHSFHRDGIAVSLKELHVDFKTCWLSAVHFNAELTKCAVLPSEGPFTIRSQAEKLAELALVRASRVVLRNEHEPCNPFLPLPRPGERCLGAAGNVFAGVKKWIGLAQSDVLRLPWAVGHLAFPSRSGSNRSQ